jgi:hypothetical protein
LGTLSFERAKADSIQVNLGAGSSHIEIPDAIIDSLSVYSGGPIRINALNLQAKSATFAADPDEIESLIKAQPLPTDIALDRSNIERNLYVGIPVGYLSLKGITVKQNAIFDVNTRTADLSFASFDLVKWRVYREQSTNIDLNGVSFRILMVTQDPSISSSIPDALDLLRKAKSPTSAFTAYQSQLKTQGESEAAEKSYVEMREVMRHQEWQHSITWPLGVVDIFQQYVLGFGHSPVPPMFWSICFVVFGTFAFRKVVHMQERVENPADFSGAWYSLELFLPIVDLGVAKEWRPKADSKWRVVYARVHQIAGWVLVPAALAAITGVVK